MDFSKKNYLVQKVKVSQTKTTVHTWSSWMSTVQIALNSFHENPLFLKICFHLAPASTQLWKQGLSLLVSPMLCIGQGLVIDLSRFQKVTIVTNSIYIWFGCRWILNITLNGWGAFGGKFRQPFSGPGRRRGEVGGVGMWSDTTGGALPATRGAFPATWVGAFPTTRGAHWVLTNLTV